MQKIVLTFFLSFVACTLCFAQNSSDLLQLSGVVVSKDTLQPVHFVNVYTKDKRNGTVSNFEGFFSFVVPKGDTVYFSAVGYQEAALVVPKEITDNFYSVIQYMEVDTVMLPEAVIYPWPTKLEFKQAFLALEIPDDDLKRARRNLDRERIRELGQVLAYDGIENHAMVMRNYSKSLYSYGQLYPYRGIFDVFAWAEFFKALKRGDFKKKKKSR